MKSLVHIEMDESSNGGHRVSTLVAESELYHVVHSWLGQCTCQGRLTFHRTSNAVSSIQNPSIRAHSIKAHPPRAE